MAKREAGAELPVVRARGGHGDLGRAMGVARASHIRHAVADALEGLRAAETTDTQLREQIAPYLEAVADAFPQYLEEIEGMAMAAEVPFDVLFRLNCHESRPREVPAGAASSSPESAKDPSVQPSPGESAPTGADGCTTAVSRAPGTIVVGHTEDGSPESVEGIYLLDATVEEVGQPASRFLALNYAFTVPGCAAAINHHGLLVLIDALPNPDRRHGVPREFMCRALLDAPDIESAIDLLQRTTRGGGSNIVLIQGQRYVNVETTATRVVITEDGTAPAIAHSNHYLDRDLAAAAGEPRPNSVARFLRAKELVRPAMPLHGMRKLLTDRHGYPDSICRDRTIAALVADSASRYIEVCWGEPDTATWTGYTI